MNQELIDETPEELAQYLRQQFDLQCAEEEYTERQIDRREAFAEAALKAVISGRMIW